MLCFCLAPSTLSTPPLLCHHTRSLLTGVVCSGKLQSVWQQWSPTVWSLLETRLCLVVPGEPLDASGSSRRRAERCHLAEFHPVAPARERARGRPRRAFLKRIRLPRDGPAAGHSGMAPRCWKSSSCCAEQAAPAVRRRHWSCASRVLLSLHGCSASSTPGPCQECSCPLRDRDM